MTFLLLTGDFHGHAHGHAYMVMDDGPNKLKKIDHQSMHCLLQARLRTLEDFNSEKIVLVSNVFYFIFQSNCKGPTLVAISKVLAILDPTILS